MKLPEATNYYKKIINEEPGYIDAYLRLSTLAWERGDRNKAIHYAKEATAKEGGQGVAGLIQTGWIYMQIKDYKSACRKFEEVLAIRKDDSYANLMIAHIMYEESINRRPWPE